MRVLFEMLFSRYSSIGVRIASLVTIFFLLVFLGLVALVAYKAADEIGVESADVAVTVVDSKYVTASYTTTTFITVGGVLVPTTHNFPQEYHLRFRINGVPLDSGVTTTFYHRVKVGDAIKVQYGYGRLSGAYTPSSIELVRNTE